MVTTRRNLWMAAMLGALIAKPGHAVTKERLFRIVFSEEDPAHLEAIEVVAHRLRKKLVGTGSSLMTLRGLGYLLREDQPMAAPACRQGGSRRLPRTPPPLRSRASGMA